MNQLQRFFSGTRKTYQQQGCAGKAIMLSLGVLLMFCLCAVCLVPISGLSPSVSTSTILPSPTSTLTEIPTLTPSNTFILTPAFTQTISATPTITLTSTITLTATITFTPQPTLSSNIVSCIPQNTVRETAKVTRVIDGDTIEVNINSQAYRVRYIGVDTPEQNQPFYSDATAINKQLVLNKTVTLVKDVSESDQFNRLLRYVIVGDTFVNLALVTDGYAVAATYPPDIACASTFATAQGVARSQEVGLWRPTATPYVVAPSGGGSSSGNGNGGNCSSAYPTVCIPPPPPDLDCPDIPYKNFQVLPPDPHNFDRDHDGIGCET
jgi:endonuclease YncB( thermonuclease family)